MRIADPWPMNPDGELIFGLKIENPRADANVETSVRVPGIAFAEWGPGDHGFFLMGRPGTYQGGGEQAENMAAVRRRVLDATKAAGVKFLNACNEKNVVDQLKDGVMIFTGGDSPAADSAASSATVPIRSSRTIKGPARNARRGPFVRQPFPRKRRLTSRRVSRRLRLSHVLAQAPRAGVGSPYSSVSLQSAG